MSRTSGAVLALAARASLALASAAAAATIAMQASVPSPGLIELAIIVDSERDDARSFSNIIVEHQALTGGSQITGLGDQGQEADLLTQFGGQGQPTVNGNQGKCAWAIGRDDQCLAFAQIHNQEGAPLDPGPRVATLFYEYLGFGWFGFSFRDVEGNDFVYASLGSESDVGTAPSGICIASDGGACIPEPGSGALLALGLVGLGASRRRRAR